MSVIAYFGLLAFIVHIYFYCVYAIISVKKRLDLLDVAWGGGFILTFWTALILTQNWSLRSLLAFVMVSIWGFRLGLHIYLRSTTRSEDFRYQKFKQQWGKWWLWKSYFQMVMVQAWILWLVAFPLFWMAAFGVAGFTVFDLFGFSLWLVGFGFEATADYQLSSFKRTAKKGAVLDTGLWRYSRHPNYFGEALMWWGLFIMAVQFNGGWAMAISPVLITWLLVRVSGVPMVESKLKANPPYRKYVERTSAFIPMPPKS